MTGSVRVLVKMATMYTVSREVVTVCDCLTPAAYRTYYSNCT